MLLAAIASRHYASKADGATAPALLSASIIDAIFATLLLSLFSCRAIFSRHYFHLRH
jgi:uncharacterized RDD family membrane protein YckC